MLLTGNLFRTLRDFPVMSKELSYAATFPWRPNSTNQEQFRVSSPYCTLLFKEPILRTLLPNFKGSFPHLFFLDAFFASSLALQLHLRASSLAHRQNKIHADFYNTHWFPAELGTLLGSDSQLRTMYLRKCHVKGPCACQPPQMEGLSKKEHQ